MELDGWVRSFQPEQTTAEEQSYIANSASPPAAESPSYTSLPAPEESEGYSEDSEADAKDGADDLLGSLRGLCIRPNPRRYFGKSSGISLLRTAITIKSKTSNEESTVEPDIHTQRRHDFWCLHPVSFHELFSPHVHLIQLNPLSLSGNLAASRLLGVILTSRSRISLRI